jgi:hypothetical protein
MGDLRAESGRPCNRRRIVELKIPASNGQEIDMQQGLTEEQVLLRDTVRKLAKEKVELVFEVALDI